MVIFFYVRIPSHIISLMPNEWGVGRSSSGWMTGQSFYEYITNVFYKWLLKKDIPLPVILFVDGHVSHLTFSLKSKIAPQTLIEFKSCGGVWSGRMEDTSLFEVWSNISSEVNLLKQTSTHANTKIVIAVHLTMNFIYIH
nr:PREDICTED: uncharacterized protein LOC105663577 [Megachile rotundata]